MGWLRRIGRILGVGLALTAAAVVWAYWASQAVPEFYQSALQASPSVVNPGGRHEFNRSLQALRSELSHGEAWALELTDAQVNAWLASDLPRQFPGLLPPAFEAPRLAFRPDAIYLGCRVNVGQLHAVVSLKLIPQLSQQANTLVVRVAGVKAGSLPMPLDQILAHVTTTARNAGIEITWNTTSGDPVATIELPVQRPELRHGVLVQTLTLVDGGFRVAGIADPIHSHVAESAGSTRSNQR